MPVDPEALAPFTSRQGPVHVVYEDGTGVTYGTSAILQLTDPSRKDGWTVDVVQLNLLDELTAPIRSIPGEQILDVRSDGVGYTVVVDRTVDRDDGPAVNTRGA